MRTYVPYVPRVRSTSTSLAKIEPCPRTSGERDNARSSGKGKFHFGAAPPRAERDNSIDEKSRPRRAFSPSIVVPDAGRKDTASKINRRSLRVFGKREFGARSLALRADRLRIGLRISRSSSCGNYSGVSAGIYSRPRSG